MSVTEAIDFRPDTPAFLADPFPVYRQLREQDPVHWSPKLKAWVLTRYDDIKAVCLDKEVSSDRLRPFFATLPGPEAARIGQIVRYLTHWMVFRDPPEHTRLRRLTSKVFNLQSMNAMRPAAEELVQWLFERIGGRKDIDFIVDFAGPLPAMRASILSSSHSTSSSAAGRMAFMDCRLNTLLVRRRRRVCSGGSRNTIQCVR